MGKIYRNNLADHSLSRERYKHIYGRNKSLQLPEVYDKYGGYIFKDCEAREIMHLVASVCRSITTLPAKPWTLPVCLLSGGLMRIISRGQSAFNEFVKLAD